MNKINVGLEDIDNVLFDFSFQQLSFLKSKNVFPESFFKDFNELQYAYIYDFLFSSKCEKIDQYRDIFRQIYKDKSEAIKLKLLEDRAVGKNSFSDFDLDLRSSFYASLDEFNSSSYFLSGSIESVVELNRLNHLKGSHFLNIGVTKRGTGLKSFDSEGFLARVRATEYWRETNNVFLDKIYFESKKERVLIDIRRDFYDKDVNFMYLIEDDPRNIEGILKKSIPVVLVKFESPMYNGLDVTLKKKYGSLLNIVEDHKSAKDVALSISDSYE